jgi:xylulokinase
MAYFIGCDLGTSALKLTLVDEKGAIVRSVAEPYPLYLPKPGYSEQDPEDWWKAFVRAVDKALEPSERRDLLGIAIAGQMHGLVALDAADKPLRNVILWNDSRSVEECRFLNETVGRPFLIEETGNIAYPGFTAPKILWMRDHEPDLYSRIAHILLPKDYLVFRLTGAYSTDFSDAAGTLLLNVRQKAWSEKMLGLMGLRREALPSLHASGEAVGTLKAEARRELSLPPNVFVLAGAADNAAAALGSGVSGEGMVNISLGTSGTIYVSSAKYLADPKGAIHSFLGGDGLYCLLACSLSSASSLRWLYEDIYGTKDYLTEERRISPAKLGHNGIYFLPYLMGERSPINDADARGLFIGMDLSSKREDLALAVLEGVSFALRDSFERIKELGGAVSSSHLTGGGSKNVLWRKILANVLNIDLSLVGEEAGASYGMAILDLLHAKAAPSLAEAERLIKPEETIHPTLALAQAYEERYRVFQKIYPAVKSLYPSLRAE